MPGETDLHKTLKKEACRWLLRMGYRCIAAEVRLPPLGIVDAVGTGIFRPYHNYLFIPKALPQVCFVECKATRSDFLRDLSNDGQMWLCLRERNSRRKSRRGRRLRHTAGLGKFDSCLMQPMANLHYVLAPTGIIQKKDLPPRWGLLCYGDAGVSVVVKALWQESARMEYAESAIARALTGDIFRADERAIHSVNRELFAQQMALAERIRSIRPRAIFAPPADQPEKIPNAIEPPRRQDAKVEKYAKSSFNLI
ncbi:MAG: hypothetical protein ABSG31_11720 [Tepidisphaeraceae bacterium]|jgi:hypothetical protein